MTNRIWVYTLAVLVFVIPICTVAAMKLEPQSVLIGSRACLYTCDDKRESVGDCGPQQGCGDGCGNVQTWTEGRCISVEAGNLVRCKTRAKPTTIHIQICDCEVEVHGNGDVEEVMCRRMDSDNTTVFKDQCIERSPC